MIFYQNTIFLYIFFALLSLLFVLLWAGFFHFYSPKKTTSKYLLLISFCLGIGTAFIALLLEIVLPHYFDVDFFFLQSAFTPTSLLSLVQPLLFSFLFIAVIEESIKFIVLKNYIGRITIEKVSDGMKIGLWVGFGVVFIENILYFINFLSYTNITTLSFFSIFLLRGFLSTLAHGLYGAIMGYYLSLAKFHRLYRFYFLRKGFITSLVLHGLFNFFLIIHLGFYSVFVLALSLFIVLLWYQGRKNIESYLSRYGLTTKSIPLFAERSEIEIILVKQKSPPALFKKVIGLFPLPRKTRKKIF